MEYPQPIIVEQVFNSSPERIWKAITEKDQMIQWFFDNIESFVPETGFKTQFNVKSGGRDFLHLWELKVVVPYQEITYHWKYEGYPGESTVTFELIKQNDQTLLRLTHAGNEGFPQDIPEFSRQSCYGGWDYFICQRLKAYLDGNKG